MQPSAPTAMPSMTPSPSPSVAPMVSTPVATPAAKAPAISNPSSQSTQQATPSFPNATAKLTPAILPKVQAFIKDARSRNIPDDQIYQALQDKGYVNPMNKQVSNPTPASNSAMATPNKNFSGLSVANDGGTDTAPTTSLTMGDVAKGVGEGVLDAGKAVATSEVGLGQDVAAAIGGSKYIDQFNNLTSNDQHYLNTVISLKDKAQATGDTAAVQHYATQLQNYKTADGQNITDVFPSLAKSNEQVLGDVLGTATDLVGAGELGDAAKGVKGAEEADQGATLGQRAIEGAKTGSKYGAAAGLAGGMQQNEGGEGLAFSTLGGAGAGAVLGGTVNAALGKGPAGEAEAKGAAKSAQQNIDAVNPDLSGKKLISAYKGTVSGTQDITPASIFREQGLTADEKTQNLGTRLSQELTLDDGSKVKPVNLSKDPVKNLGALGSSLEETESKLQTSLDGDPEVNYNADKPAVMSKLDDLKTQMPREFSAIKDSKSVFSNVVDFAKETIANSEDSIKGIRNARSAFDAQAQKEYPSAYKGAGIDVSTPAGRAISAVRNTINEHLYNTAPNGSEIQNLIGREADIFRAAENIAPKAAKGEGKNLISQVIKKYPTLARFIGYGATALGLDKAIKVTTGVGV